MGSCISKCKRKKKFKEDCSCSHVHDKLVISQDHPKSSIPSNSTPPAMLKPIVTPSQSSSFSCSNNSKSCATTMASSISSSSSSSCNSSSVLIGAKDRSFSNEFLWSCVKENPHIIGVKQSHENPKRTPLQNLEHSIEFSPFVTRTKHSVQENLTAPTPKKRVRANSPTLVRQKSFRKEQNRGLRSPSPSRKFVGENDRSILADANSCKGPIFPKASATNNSLSYDLKKESFLPPAASPNRDFAIKRDVSVRKMDAFSQQASKKIGGDHVVGEDIYVVGEDIRSRQGLDIVMEEDINNPLIALDCFIFL